MRVETGRRCCLKSEERSLLRRGHGGGGDTLFRAQDSASVQRGCLAQEGLGKDVGRRAGKNRLVRQA